MAKQHDKQFKLDAVQYYRDHKNLGIRGCAENLGIGYSTLTKWLKDFRESGDIPVRGSGNYASDVLTIGIVLCLFYIICGTVSFVRIKNKLSHGCSNMKSAVALFISFHSFLK
ncbi:MAG: transposase [Ruminococcus sp.]